MAGPNWASIGSLPTGGSNWVPHVTQTIDGHLEVFTLDSQGALWHTRQITPNGHWNPWALVAHPPTNQVGADSQLETTVNADGRLEVFTFDAQGGLWHIWQSSSGAGWSQWTSLGNPFAGATRDLFIFSVVKNADGRLELFTSGKDGVLHIWQIAPNGTWSSWASLAHPPNVQLGGAPVVGTNADGRLEVFSFDPQGTYWHTWQQVSGGSWSPWTQFDTPAGLSVQASDLTTGQEADGRLMVFFRDSSGALWYTS